jgi:hypothetical protein
MHPVVADKTMYAAHMSDSFSSRCRHILHAYIGHTQRLAYDNTDDDTDEEPREVRGPNIFLTMTIKRMVEMIRCAWIASWSLPALLVRCGTVYEYVERGSMGDREMGGKTERGEARGLRDDREDSVTLYPAGKAFSEN